MFLKKSKLVPKFFFSVSLLLPQVCFSEAPYLELKEKVFDFGRVDEGSIVEKTFLVKNSGSADLRIEKVVTGCNCLENDSSNILIAPNEEKEFHIKLNTTGLSGEYDKKVRFFTNEGGHSFNSYSVKGYINPQVKIEPAILDFEEITTGDSFSKTKILKISTNKHNSIEIVKVESYSKNIQIHELSGDKHEKTYEVKLNGKISLGEYRNRIIAFFSNGKKVNIPLIVIVHNIIEVEPKVISFGDLSSKNTPIKKVVSVINRSEGRCKITDIEASSSIIEASLQENDGRQVIAVQIDPKDLKRSIKERLVLESDCEQQSNILLGVHAFYKKKVK